MKAHQPGFIGCNHDVHDEITALEQPLTGMRTQFTAQQRLQYRVRKRPILIAGRFLPRFVTIAFKDVQRIRRAPKRLCDQLSDLQW